MRVSFVTSIAKFVAAPTVLTILAALPASAAPSQAPQLSECHQCLWTYAESYNYDTENPFFSPPQAWVDYARKCCAACVNDRDAQALLNEYMQGAAVAACIQGAISTTEIDLE